MEKEYQLTELERKVLEFHKGHRELLEIFFSLSQLFAWGIISESDCISLSRQAVECYKKENEKQEEMRPST